MAMMDLKGKRVMVMGLGRFGGGIGAARWLCARGADVTVTDTATEAALAGSLSQLQGCDVRLRLGGHDPADLAGCDLVVVSPAVDRRKSAFLTEALHRGIALSSEMNLFLERCPARIVGITGSAGKSTTTAMTAAILERAVGMNPGGLPRRVWVGGNIGRSLLYDLAEMQRDDVVVLELSSFQLEEAARIGFRPDVALVTNIRENHLDRHGTLEAYAAAKAEIYNCQSPEDVLLLPLDAGAEHLPGLDRCRARILRYGADFGSGSATVPDVGGDGFERVRLDLALPGAHNLANAAGAMGIARMLGIGAEVSAAALKTFAGLPHRLEFVRELHGARYFNDSKATSPEAAVTSMQAFSAPCIVLLGGSSKGAQYEALGAHVARHAKAAVCFGETGPAIRQAVKGKVDCRRAETACVDTLHEALTVARRMAAAGDVVLLSPACASYDQFANYEERGDLFRAIVMAWA